MDVKELSGVKLKQTIANFIIPLIAVVLSLGLLGLYIYPSLTDIPLLNSELKERTELSQQLVAKVEKLNSLLDFKQNVDDSSSLVSRALSEEPLVPQLLTQVDQIARESGLAITRMSYALNDTGEADPSVGNYQVVAVNLSVAGNYNQVVTFLTNLENSSRVINISTVRFTVDEDEGTIDTNLVLISPYVSVSAQANTDEPITFDITAPEFQQLMDRLKNMRHYDINVEEFIDITALPGADLPVESVPAEGAPTEGLPGDVVIETVPDVPVVPEISEEPVTP